MPLVPSDSSTTAVTNSNTVPVTILNVSDQFGSYGKPNAIVRPVRRIESLDEMIQPPASSLPPSTQMNNATLARNDRHESDSKKIQREVDFFFTKELDFKLKHLQRDKKASSKNVNFHFKFESFSGNRRDISFIQSGRSFC